MILTDDNLEIYAIQNYKNNNCVDIKEFRQDFYRIKYIRRLIKRYETYGDLRERLILNHLVVLYNVFDNNACTRMIFFKLENYLSSITPFLLFINRLPKEVLSYENKIIYTTDIKMNDGVISALRKI